MAKCKPGDLQYTLERLDILPADRILPHETVKESGVYSLREEMNRLDSVLRKKMSPLPIMVTPHDDRFVILDGHHRYSALETYGCPYVLAYVVGEGELAALRGWDAIVCAMGDDYGIETVFEQTIEDLSRRDTDEYAGGIKVTLKKAQGVPFDKLQEMVLTDPKISFAVYDRDGISWWLEKEDGGALSLDERIQFMKDFDEALEEQSGYALGQEGALLFTADTSSYSDFTSRDDARFLVVRSRFTLDEVKAIAGGSKLCPKKTTRFIFELRPFVKIPLAILSNHADEQVVRREKMRRFIHEHCIARYYAEPIHNLMDVNRKLDISNEFLGRENMARLKEELEKDPYRQWAREWCPDDGRVTAVPGPIGFSRQGTGFGVALVGHRSGDFSELYRRTTAGIKWVLDPEGSEETRTYRAFLIGGSASLAMETALLSAVPPDGGVLHIVAGAFGNRWKDIADSHGMRSDVVTIRPGGKVDENIRKSIEKKLKTGLFDAVTVVHNETSTGTVYPVDELYEIVAEAERRLNKDILYLVDAATSFGGMPIPALRHIDFLVVSTEKCLAVPPGVSALVVSPKGIVKNQDIEAAANRTMGFSTSLSRINRYHLQGQTLTTPAIPQIVMTLQALLSISGYLTVDGRVRCGEGLDKRYARFRELAELVRRWGQALGMEPLAEDPRYYSSTVTALRVTKLPVSADAVAEKALRLKNMEISAGHRQLTDENGRKIEIIRIPTMGDMTREDLEDILASLTDVIASMIDDPGLTGVTQKEKDEYMRMIQKARGIIA